MGKAEISVNASTAHKFLKSTGLNVSKDGRDAMQKELNEFASKIAKIAASFATAKGRKTIMKDEVKKAFENVKFEEVTASAESATEDKKEEASDEDDVEDEDDEEE